MALVSLYTVDVLADGLGHPQGPDLLQDGSLIFAETYTGAIRKLAPNGELSTVARVGGGPNAVSADPDGSIWFTQNGGQAGQWRSAHSRTPSLSRLTPDLEIEVVATQSGGVPFLAPHDLARGADGSIYMTDSGTWDPEDRSEPGRIIRRRVNGDVETVAELGNVYPSGVAVERDGAVVWAECYTNRLYRKYPGEAPQLIRTLPGDHVPECIKSGPEGTLWVAGLFTEGIAVLDRFGRDLDFIRTGGLPLNCALSETDLFVTDLGPFDEELDPAVAQMGGRILRISL
ncbi:SMP-30/gluconolactonase/LRE family protein [Leifsonia shinshuensis]|uniref:SMP-30/Gluconolactonase/LRE-like region domain-containing protein n=1 Tax=Leifsonia shinshuensis TaxID=150026 RepID=A0A7G6YA94_9MICO|nr:SMP-30/gluconolactonase/LRE family protein [Leifsonia shinshuensis]QNE35409.1 hypothetical protein F1C12_09895 [Leifsonia shinshuensis]